MYGSEMTGRFGRSRRRSPGLILLALALGFMLLHSVAASGAIPLLVLGGIFIALSQGHGPRALLIPGGILLGLGGGNVLASIVGHLSAALAGAAVVGGLGAGFWLIYLIGSARPFKRGDWDSELYAINRGFRRDALVAEYGWARIPGTILLAVSAFLSTIGLTSMAWRLTWSLAGWWPVLLIAGGLVLFFSNLRERRRS